MCIKRTTLKEQDNKKRSNKRTIDFSIERAASAANCLGLNLDLLKKTKDNL